ncbi:MAG: hypothetical protein AAF384_17495 [Pseudomonadota bacterium]
MILKPDIAATGVGAVLAAILAFGLVATNPSLETHSSEARDWRIEAPSFLLPPRRL